VTKSVAGCRADPRDVTCSLLAHAYQVKVRNLSNGLIAKDFTRQQLDRLGIKQGMKMIPWALKRLNYNLRGILVVPSNEQRYTWSALLK